MFRPQAREKPSASHHRRFVGTIIALALSFAALVAMPQTAQAADVVAVPDANFKAVLNTAIATTNGTTRTPDQDITRAEAQSVTMIDTGFVEGAPIASLTGLEAFTNVTSLTLMHMGSTAADLRPIGSLNQLTLLSVSNMPFTNLDALESVETLQYLEVWYNDQLADVSALSKLTHLIGVVVVESPRLRDISALAASKSTLETVWVEGGAVEDIDFLEGFKRATKITLSNNRIEDVSVFGRFDDSYALNDSIDNQLNLNGNRIRDFSPVRAFHAIKGVPYGPRVYASGQSIYVGPYDAANGVRVLLKSGPNVNNSNPPATPTVEPGVGTYDAGTGVLTSADPAAPFVTVSPNWTVHFSEAPDRLAALRINEVESNGDTVNGDWVELYNPGSTVVDLSGLVVSDNDNTHKLMVPAGTKIPAQGYQSFVTDNAARPGAFGLGSADSVRIFAPGTTDLAAATPIDSYTWTAHATTTYGRTIPGAGTWATTSAGTFGAANEFPPPTVIPAVTITGDSTSTTGNANLTANVTKPSSTTVATDATGTVVFTVDGTDRPAVPVTNGVATEALKNLIGSPSGTAHTITARYLSSGDSDPYDDSAISAPFTVTVTIGEFTGAPTLSTTTPRYCDTITSTVTGITPTPDQIKYQWQQAPGSGSQFVDIPGATGPTRPVYTVDGTSVDVALQRYRLLVTATKAGYASKTFSLDTAAVASKEWDAAAKKTAVLSTSTPKVGDTITATHDAWTTCFPAALNYRPGYEYQWLRDGQPIAGATDSVAQGIGAVGPKQVSYAVTTADLGHTISLQVFGLAAGHLSVDSARTVSAPTAAVASGAFTTAPAPVIDKMSPKLGDTLTATTAAWSPAATMARQWLRDGQPISGATAATYTTTVADVGHAISVRVTGTAAGYAATEKTSAATGQVAAGAFTVAPAPVIDDTTPTEGDTLTASVASWTPGATHAWQWLRDGQPIAGATQATYPVVSEDVGHVLTARVTGTATGYQTRSETSQPTAAVAAKPQVQAPAPVNVTVTSKYAVKIKAVTGKKLNIAVAAKDVPAAALDTQATLKVAGLKGAYKVKIKDGKATVALKAKAKTKAKGDKLRVTLVLPKLVFATTTGTTTTSYTVTKATEQVTVKLK